MQGPHQSEPEKLIKMYLPEVAASVFALLKSENQTGLLAVNSEPIRKVRRNFIINWFQGLA
jgi:hypothetical protein